MADPSPSEITDAVKERFWAKVDAQGRNECWPWTACRDKEGYGVFGVARSNRRANRIALILSKGWPSEIGQFACHSCDNPSCCNPGHLWWGTNSANIRDAKAKGRHFYASRTHCKRGHPFDDDNTRLVKQYNGGGIQRLCNQCIKLRSTEATRRRATRLACNSASGWALR